MDFVETIYRILVPGGIWVNLGPLLYHFSDIPNEDSIEPTYEDLMPIIGEVGFEVLSSETGIRTKYAQNPQSMLKSEYESLFWICRKPVDDDEKKGGRGRNPHGNGNSHSIDHNNHHHHQVNENAEDQQMATTEKDIFKATTTK